jgi:dynein heavy chain 2
MSVPDNELIAEVLLTSEGFATAADLARKLVSLFSLAGELLSPQQHYDWGLRALKTSLSIAGALPDGLAYCHLPSMAVSAPAGC